MLQFSKSEKAVLKGIFVFLFFWYGSYFQLIPVYLFHLDHSNLSIAMRVVLSTFSSFIIAIVLFFLYRKELIEEFKKFKKNLLENIDTGFHYWLIGLGIMIISNLILTFVFNTGTAKNEAAVQEMIQALPYLMILDAGILAPFNEEIVFRKTLKDIFLNHKWLFVISSFLLFGGAHVIGSASSWKDYLFIIPYGALGASFAVAYAKSDTVFTSMTVHMIHNISLILISIL